MTNFDLEASVNYARKFGAHKVTGLMLYKQNTREVNNQVPYNYVGVVGRTTYGYDNKYLAEFNFGMNGSEQFASGRRFGFFPSLSLGWVLSQESFLSGSEAIEFLKIRGSFGQVGNDKISNGRFLYIENWTQGMGGYFDSMGKIPGLPSPVYEASIPNEFVMWEVANKANVGIESRFLGGFEWDVDLFYEKRNSILTTVTPIPTYMYGQRSLPPLNDGVMSNRGFESTLGYTKSVNKDWFIGARFSASFARNRIEAMNETPLDDTYAYPYRTEGFSRGTTWGYDCLGYFANDEEIAGWADMSGLGASVMPGDLKFRDVNDDGVIDTKDYIPMDHPTVPEWNYSLTLNTQYKGFDFSVLLHAVDNFTYNLSAGNGRGVYDWQGNEWAGIKDYYDHHRYAWTADKADNGGDIRYPRMHVDGVSVSKQPSNYFKVDLWYMRVKNIEFGYTLPKNATKRLGLEKLRFYVNGANVFTFDNMPYKQSDPEIASGTSYPIYSTYNMGVNITF
jgi:TonB-linked SusC/RagA family outer membrane protein